MCRSFRTRKDHVSFHPLAWGKVEPQKLASRPRPNRLRDKRAGWRGFGMSSQAKATQTWKYRIREMKAMYRSRIILARTLACSRADEVSERTPSQIAAGGGSAERAPFTGVLLERELLKSKESIRDLRSASIPSPSYKARPAKHRPAARLG